MFGLDTFELKLFIPHNIHEFDIYNGFLDVEYIKLKGLFPTRSRCVTLFTSVLSINNYFSLITIS